jgi:AcrR family transcriptional regulator
MDRMEKVTGSDRTTGGRRHYLRRDQRRAQIVAAARPVFAERGFHATTIEEIIAAARVAQGTLYLHFTSKNEVFHAVMEDALARITDIARPLDEASVRASAVDPNSVFAYIKEKNLRVLVAVRDDRDLLSIILREAPGLDRRTDEILSRIYGVFVGQVKTELSIFQDLGLIAPVDLEVIAPMVVGTMISAVIHFLTAEDRPELESLAAKVTRFQFYGFGRREDPGRTV